ncbi:MAG: ABC transporter permease [Tissierellia bacterium]|nr:ABC transporter permease [Tissierellia bacterium]
MIKKLFRGCLFCILLLAIVFVALPFFAVIAKGLGFLVTWPYPKEVQRAFSLSMKTSFFAATLCLCLTLPIVYYKNTLPHRMNESLHYIFSLPMATPHLVSGIGLLIIFGRKGIGNFLFTHFGIDFVYTVSGIWLAMVFVNLPYSIITLDNSYQLVDQKLLFTARTLGLSESKVFLHVLIPLLKGPLVGLWLMNWARSIGEFGAIMVLVGVTRNKTETLATSIFLNLSTGDFDVASGIAALLLLISMVVMFFFQRLSRRKNGFN